ncbi:hypothetical protein AN393_03911 [Pseudoalteromonas sp. P1-25]|nr:hypothetical protein AN393_03911 [Pseudoalteromonas sp. P1-25]
MPPISLLVPCNVGVRSFTSPTFCIVSVGACVSIVVVSLTVVSLPTLSRTLTSIVLSPSLSGVLGVALQSPFASTSAVMVCGLPSLSVTTIVTCAPSPASLVPLIIGVLLLLCASTSTVSVGGVLSKSSELIVRVLPAASVAVAITEPTSRSDTSKPTNDQLPLASVVVV